MRPLKNSAIVITLYGIIIATLGGCASYEEPAPLDIISGKIDIQQEYYRAKLKKPVLITGRITDRKTTTAVSRATITATSQNSATKYTSTTLEDGTFNLYVEGGFTYAFFGEKTGYDKSYYAERISNVADTTFFIESAKQVDIGLWTYDPTPKFKVAFLSSRFVYEDTQDLSFNGTNIITFDQDYDYFNYYDLTGKYLKSVSMGYAPSFFTFQGTDAFWSGTTSGSYLYKIDIKTGQQLSTVLPQIPLNSFYDVELFNNNIWLLASTSLYKLSMTGDAQGSFDFKNIIDVYRFIGIVQKSNYLYVLILNNIGEHIMYKIDPATLKVVSKGPLPFAMNSQTLKGLAFDNTNFWTADKQTESVVKFSITE